MPLKLPPDRGHRAGLRGHQDRDRRGGPAAGEGPGGVQEEVGVRAVQDQPGADDVPGAGS